MHIALSEYGHQIGKTVSEAIYTYFSTPVSPGFVVVQTSTVPALLQLMHVLDVAAVHRGETAELNTSRSLSNGIQIHLNNKNNILLDVLDIAAAHTGQRR